jgi:hypothetical protein
MTMCGILEIKLKLIHLSLKLCVTIMPLFVSREQKLLLFFLTCNIEQHFCPVMDAPFLTVTPVNVIWVSPVEGTARKIRNNFVTVDAVLKMNAPFLTATPVNVIRVSPVEGTASQIRNHFVTVDAVCVED